MIDINYLLQDFTDTGLDVFVSVFGIGIGFLISKTIVFKVIDWFRELISAKRAFGAQRWANSSKYWKDNGVQS